MHLEWDGKRHGLGSLFGARSLICLRPHDAEFQRAFVAETLNIRDIPPPATHAYTTSHISLETLARGVAARASGSFDIIWVDAQGPLCRQTAGLAAATGSV